MGAFSDSVAFNTNKMLKEVDTKCHEIAEKLFIRVVFATPVLRGNLINDWHVAENSYSSACLSPVDADFNSTFSANSDKTGSGSISRIKSFSSSGTFLSKNGFLSLTNNLPYAYQIEYTGWSKNKAPLGMVRISLRNVASEIKGR